MNGIEIGFPFDVRSANPIDVRLLLTKAQMLAINDNMMPENYFAICSDDGKLYLYDKSATAGAETGKFSEFAGGGGGGTELTIDESQNSAQFVEGVNTVSLHNNTTNDTVGMTIAKPGTYITSAVLATKDYVDAHAGTTYTAGAGLTLTGTTFATDDATDAEVANMLTAVFGS